MKGNSKKTRVIDFIVELLNHAPSTISVQVRGRQPVSVIREERGRAIISSAWGLLLLWFQGHRFTSLDTEICKK